MIRTKDPYIGRFIRVIYCWAVLNPSYANCKQDSIHSVIKPEDDKMKNCQYHVWIRGEGQDVLLWKGEYEFINFERTKFPKHGKK